MRVLVALGGNALLERDERADAGTTISAARSASA